MADSSPTFTAELLGIKPLTLRRWCDYHADHLSAGTNPPSGQARRFTDKDIEILKHIKHLRSQGFNTATINAQLAGVAFAIVDNDEQSAIDSEELAPTTAQGGLQQAPASGLAPEYLTAIERRFWALERRRFDTITVLGVGICIGLLFAAILIGLAWLYGGR